MSVPTPAQAFYNTVRSTLLEVQGRPAPPPGAVVPPALNPALAADYFARDLLSQSNLDLAGRTKLQRDLAPILTEVFNLQSTAKAPEVVDQLDTFVSKNYLAQSLKRSSTWLASPQGGSFLTQSLPSLQSLPGSVLGGVLSAEVRNVSKKDLGKDETFKALQKLFGGRQGASAGGGPGFTLGESYSTTFDVFGHGNTRKDTAMVHNVQVKVGTQSFRLPVYVPGKVSGLVASNLEGNLLPGQSPSLYAVPQKFLTNFNPAEKTFQTFDYQKFQVHLLEQLKGELEKASGNPEAQRRLVDLYMNRVQSQQMYFGDVGLAGLPPNEFSTAHRSKMASLSGTVAYVPGYEHAPGVGNTTLPEALVAGGKGRNPMVYSLGAGQSGNIIESGAGDLTLSVKGHEAGVAPDPGYDLPAYKERNKQIGDLTPSGPVNRELTFADGTTKTAPARTPLFPEHGDALKRGGAKLEYNMEAVAFTAAPSRVYQPKAQKELLEKLIVGAGKTSEEVLGPNVGSSLNLFAPDGGYIFQNRVAQEGRASVGGLQQYAIGFAGGGTYTSNRMASFLQGGEYAITSELGVLSEGMNPKHPANLPEITAISSFQNKAWSALGSSEKEEAVKALKNLYGDLPEPEPTTATKGAKGQSLGRIRVNLETGQLEDKVEGIYDLLPGEVIGTDEEGKLVKSAEKRNVQERVLSLTRKGDDILSVTTGARTDTRGDSPHVAKIVAGPQAQQLKGHMHFWSTDNFKRFLPREGQAESLLDVASIDQLFDMADLAKAEPRNYYQAGATQLALSSIGRDDLAALDLAPDDYLKRVIHEAEATAKAQGSSLEGRSVESILAGWVQNQNLPGEEKQKVLNQALSPLNRLSRTEGALDDGFTVAFLEEGRMKVQAQKRLSKDLQESERQLLDSVFGLAPDPVKSQAEKAIVQENILLNTRIAGSIRDEGNRLGMGQLASLEPRFFDAAIAQRGTLVGKAFADVTSRMTDFTPIMKELSEALVLRDPAEVASVAGTLDGLPVRPLTKEALPDIMKALGQEPFFVDLGEGAAQEISGAAHDAARPSGGGRLLYVPAGESVRSMGTVTTASGYQKPKDLSALYRNFFQEALQKPAEAYETFHKGIEDQIRIAFRGVPGSGIHGLLRGDVAGSVVGVNMGMTEALGIQLGLLPTSATAIFPPFAQSISMADGSVVQGDDLEALRALQKETFQKHLADGGRLSRQVFMSHAAARAQYESAIRFAQQKGDASLEQAAKGQLDTLLGGGTVSGIVARDPGIGMESFGAADLWVDLSSPETEAVHVIRTNQEMQRVNQVNVRRGTGSAATVEELTQFRGKEFQVGLLQGLNMDHDGDRPKVFAVLGDEAQAGLKEAARQESSHGVRYGVMKQFVAENMTKNAATLTAVLEKYGAGMAPGAVDAVAHSSTAQYVPFLSDPFTHLKFAASHVLGKRAEAMSATDPAGAAGVRDVLSQLFGIAEGGEQIPISGKRIAQQAPLSQQYKTLMGEIGRDLWTDTPEAAAKTRTLIGAFFETLFNTTPGEALPVLEIEMAPGPSASKAGTTNQAERVFLDVANLRDEMIGVVEEARQDKTLTNAIQVLRSKSKDMTPEALSSMSEYIEEYVSTARGGLDEATSKANLETFAQNVERAVSGDLSGIDQSRAALAAQNAQTIQQGTARAAAASPGPSGPGSGGSSRSIAEAIDDLTTGAKNQGGSGFGAKLKEGFRAFEQSGFGSVAKVGLGAGLALGAAALALRPTWSDGGSGGAHIDPEFLFPEDMTNESQINAAKSAFPAPTAILGSESYQATIYNQTAINDRGLQAVRQKLSVLPNTSGTLAIQDMRERLNAASLSRKRQEIV